MRAEQCDGVPATKSADSMVHWLEKLESPGMKKVLTCLDVQSRRYLQRGRGGRFYIIAVAQSAPNFGWPAAHQVVAI